MMDTATRRVQSGQMLDLIHEHLAWMEEPRQAYRPRSIECRRRVLIHAHHHLPRGLGDVWPHEVHAYIFRPRQPRPGSSKPEPLSPWTARTNFSHLAGFYRWAAEQGEISYDPTAELPIPPHGPFLPKPLSPAEVRYILEHSPEPWLTAAILAIGAGLRASEIADADREDITESYIHVREGKGGKARLVETCATVWNHVRDLPPGPLVRRAYGRGRMTGHDLSCQQRAHWLSIGMPHVHLHRLRHTFCTIMFDAGSDALTLRGLMGHASVLTTQGYALVSSARRRAAVGAIDDALADVGARAGL